MGIKFSDGSEVFAPIRLDDEILTELYELAKRYRQNGLNARKDKIG